MNALLSIWTWVEIGIVALVGFFVQLVIAIFTLPFDKTRYATGRCFRLVGVTAAKLTPYWRFRVHGAVPDTVAPNTVVVSNHESNADPFLISHLPWEMKWLGKANLFKIPVVGWMMSIAGDIPVHRGDRESATGAMARCKEWMEKGMPVMIFPEGTRSKTDELLPFKDGAFRLAIERQADVLPLAVSGTRKALPKHSWRFSTSRGLVTVGTPISTKGMTMDDLEKLKTLAREQILSLRASLQPLTRDADSAPGTASAA
ncbi:lysophospholipid acyltransferase family protein [Myxococcus qinghaiensis]|uniref:lysophospholipid acyltransferase family protein n=1 Tax=Myxococcus qinghaiensis TaxID=2906758 RepID=UPI0020A77AC3|nr:lysophospholipid acyltransferase family protein [Myxococcus qinghaiensis]MCP3162232.1 1-acyl-sn-glycerol-3-phosphate acyltransferase [Myxococcus qinghaiensis]